MWQISLCRLCGFQMSGRRWKPIDDSNMPEQRTLRECGDGINSAVGKCAESFSRGLAYLDLAEKIHWGGGTNHNGLSDRWGENAAVFWHALGTAQKSLRLDWIAVHCRNGTSVVSKSI